MADRSIPVNWSTWIRQTHRWLSIAFTVSVIATFVALAVGEGQQPAAWVTYSPLLGFVARFNLNRQLGQRRHNELAKARVNVRRRQW